MIPLINAELEAVFWELFGPDFWLGLFLAGVAAAIIAIISHVYGG